MATFGKCFLQSNGQGVNCVVDFELTQLFGFVHAFPFKTGKKTLLTT